MHGSIINIVNVMVNKMKPDIYDYVIKFKGICKNLYHWYCEDDLDGLLEQPKIHETDSIPAEFPGVDFDADEADGTSIDQEVAN